MLSVSLPWQCVGQLFVEAYVSSIRSNVKMPQDAQAYKHIKLAQPFVTSIESVQS